MLHLTFHTLLGLTCFLIITNYSHGFVAIMPLVHYLYHYLNFSVDLIVEDGIAG